MRKIFISSLLLVSVFTYSQNKNKKIKSLISIEKSKVNNDTIIYTFENGKLTSKKGKCCPKIYYYYNNKGLLQKEMFEDGNVTGLIEEINYEYNTDGYFSKIIQTCRLNDNITSSDLPRANQALNERQNNTDEYIYEFNKNGYKITINTTTTNIKYPLTEQRIYELVNNELKSTRLGFPNTSMSSKTVENYILVNGNIINRQNKNTAISIDFKYDDKKNVFAIILEEMFGDKYFINSFSKNAIRNDYFGIISQNNYISTRNIKVSKKAAYDEINSSYIYNSDNLPTEILTTIENDKIDYSFKTSIKYL